MLLVSYKGDAAELLQQRIPFTFHVNIVTWRDVCREKCVKRGGIARTRRTERDIKRQTEKEADRERDRGSQNQTEADRHAS